MGFKSSGFAAMAWVICDVILSKELALKAPHAAQVYRWVLVNCYRNRNNEPVGLISHFTVTKYHLLALLEN